ncbi:uncharacterized protein LOC107465628 [Arachis duranensis]|uniref:Uncharacterized protein LOC107465628 n=1 Tax=Arachis duranensis TaxID=130453 RepID=A0A6P4BCN1_ARADU|nr:uncharacterized protein LOC107465628 [Arachis duranensis]
MMSKKMDGLHLAVVSTTNQPPVVWRQNEESYEEQQPEQVQHMHHQISGPNDFHGDTYNSSWRNHPNLRWGENQNSWQRNSNPRNSRNINHQNHQHQEFANKNQEASLRNLERQIGQLSKQPAERLTNAFLSDSIPNPKEECKAIQLRSERALENDKVDSKKEVAAEEKDQEKLKKKEEEPQASRKGKKVMKEQPQEQRKEVKHYTPPLPYPQRLQRELKDQQFPKFLEIFKKLEINLPLVEALEQMPLYAKFLKEVINKKRSSKEKETVILTQECSAVIHKGLPPKLKDLRSFFLPCTIGNISIDKALCDLGSSINLMPLSMMRRLSIEEVKPTRMSLQLADKSIIIPNGVVENLLVKVGKFIFPANFMILDLDDEGSDSIILGRPFLAIARAIIDMEKGEKTLRAHDEKIILNAFKEMQHPVEKKG